MSPLFASENEQWYVFLSFLLIGPQTVKIIRGATL
jgi:hypothetical protein